MATVIPSKRSDRRASSRYSVQKIVRYRVAGKALASLWKRGQSLDMSATGLRVRIPESFMPGTKLELSMDWNGLFHGKEAVRLTLIASVVRTNQRGTALRILRARFSEIRIRQAERAVA